MIALKRVLVPTDFSDASEAAVKYGVALARAFNAKLDLLHVVVRHELDVSVERQRVVDTLLAEMTAGRLRLASTRACSAARDARGILRKDEEELLRYALRASGRRTLLPRSSML